MEEKETKVEDYTGMIPKTAVDLTQNHLDQVVTGLDYDSVSRLGNGIVASRLWRPRTIAAVQGESPVRMSPSSRLSVSDQSYSTMSSRISLLEDKLTSMEVNITSAVGKSIATMMAQLSSTNSKPDGGESGKENE